MICFALLIAVVTFFTFIKAYGLMRNDINSFSAPPVVVEQEKKVLSDVIQKVLEGATGTYGVVVKNLKNGDSFFLNEHKVYEPGSLYKVWIMAEAFREIQNGKLKEDETLSQDIAVLNQKFEIDPELAELKEGTISLSVRDALNQMITISHNYAALLLTERIKLINVDYFLKENGFNESIVGINGGSPQTTPYDISLFFEKLYKGELANKEYTDKMLSLLTEQTFNNKIPKYLPKNTVVAHKTGEIDYLSHDAGIVFGENGDYIIVVLSESDFPPGAEERIADISKAVFDYFAKN